MMVTVQHPRLLRLRQHLGVVQLRVASPQGKQLFVSALLKDVPVLYQHDAVGVPHCSEPVSDDDRSPSLREFIEAPLYPCLCHSVER